MKAILFGAIGTLAETSDVQRRAFNRAFADAGLDWHWDWETYADLLREPGGAARVAKWAATQGAEVDAKAIHAAKEVHFEAMADEITPREGLDQITRAARSRGLRMGVASTTSRAQLRLILAAVSDALPFEELDFVGDRLVVQRVKPAPDIYEVALDRLGLPAQDVLAIEDTPESAEAAVAAGLHVAAVPGQGAIGRTFPEGVTVYDRLTPRILDGKPGAKIAAE